MKCYKPKINKSIDYFNDIGHITSTNPLSIAWRFFITGVVADKSTAAANQPAGKPIKRELRAFHDS